MIIRNKIDEYEQLLRESRARWNLIPGPWDNEPNSSEFKSHGLYCLALRNPMWFWCGYVGIPPGHPLYQKTTADKEVRNLDVHGGITYSDECQGPICHIPKHEELDQLWWLGFDCAHSGDIIPGMESFKSNTEFMKELREKLKFIHKETYKTLYYVQAETENLAEQLAKMI